MELEFFENIKILKNKKCSFNNHNYKISAICLNSSCQNKLICVKCFIFHKNCFDTLIYLEDFEESNLENILDYPKFKAISNIFRDIENKKQTKTEHLNLINVKINKFLEIISTMQKDKLSNFLNEINLYEIAQKCSFADFCKSFKFDELIKICNQESDEEKIKENFNSFSKNYEDAYNIYYEKFKLEKILEQNFDLFEKDLDKYLNECISFTEKTLSLSNLMKLVIDMKKNYIWTFEAKINKSNLIFDKNNLSARKINSEDFNPIIGKVRLNKDSGKKFWKITIKGLIKNCNAESNQLIKVGIINEEYINNANNYNYNSSIIGYSSNFKKDNMEIVNQDIIDYKNDCVDVLECQFNSGKSFEIKLITVKGKTINLKRDSFSFQTYCPICIMYETGNEVFLSFD